eukprot:CAMPEP_0179238892 /NCGR_PEP_ID=MMETSP0797-20121207/15184_1 /TAXON_ID=47934 /ORGANISM="Dinophysis acuminata, Strain DAEP01" /LENGTH=386 /DNA_ID=CAMNT_0020946207 /DNA_START=1 /DNA_END=1158 /DNA_ORIENTATION=+
MDQHWLAAQRLHGQGGPATMMAAPMHAAAPMPAAAAMAAAMQQAAAIGGDITGRMPVGMPAAMPGACLGMPIGMPVGLHQQQHQAVAMQHAASLQVAAMQMAAMQTTAMPSSGGMAPHMLLQQPMIQPAVTAVPTLAAVGAPQQARDRFYAAGHGPAGAVPEHAHCGNGGCGGAAASGGGGSASDSHAVLVRRVKRLQRENDVQRHLWWQWCEANGHGVRDPKRHTSQFIVEFFNALSHNQIPNVSVKTGTDGGPIGGGGGSGPAIGPVIGNGAKGLPIGAEVEGDAMHEELISRVKEGQRHSLEWKRMWWRHCDQHGGGVRDPRRHESAFILQFLEQHAAEVPSAPPPTYAGDEAAAHAVGPPLPPATGTLSLPLGPGGAGSSPA